MFTRTFTEGSHIRDRAYNLIIPRVPITLDPKEEKHLREIPEINGLDIVDKLAITKAKWISQRFTSSWQAICL